MVITITYDPSLWNVTTCIWNRVSVFSSAEYISAICIFHNFFIQVLLLFWGWKHFISIFSIRSSLSSSVSTEISWYVQNGIDLQTYQLFFLYQLQKSKPHILRTESIDIINVNLNFFPLSDGQVYKLVAPTWSLYFAITIFSSNFKHLHQSSSCNEEILLYVARLLRERKNKWKQMTSAKKSMHTRRNNSCTISGLFLSVLFWNSRVTKNNSGLENMRVFTGALYAFQIGNSSGFLTSRA